MARYGRQSSMFQSKKAAPQFHEKPVSQAVDWEKRLLEKIRAAGLPEPVREHLFARPIKRRWRADFAYPDAVPPILIEVEGGIWTRGRHTRGSGYEDDCRKYNKANLLGFILLRFTPTMIQNGEAVEDIQEALAYSEKAWDWNDTNDGTKKK